jgi:hypothetical protein
MVYVKLLNVHVKLFKNIISLENKRGNAPDYYALQTFPDLSHIYFLWEVTPRKYKCIPNNTLLLFNIFLHYNTFFRRVSIRVGIIFRDTFKS